MTSNKVRNLVVIAIVAAGIAGSGIVLYRNLDGRPAAGPEVSAARASMGAAGVAKTSQSATAPGSPARTIAELAATVGGAAPTTAEPASGPLPTIDVAAERMAKRLQASGGTGDEWALLARTYMELKRYPDAVAAYGRAIEKMPGNDMLLTEQGSARAAAALPTRQTGVPQR